MRHRSLEGTDVSLSPSGTQIDLQRGDQSAVVASVGGGIRRYVVGGRDVLDGYDVDVMADGARGQTLIPWPNRVRDGKWSWRGSQLQLALTEPEQHNAIHGLVRWLGWNVVDRGDDHVTLACTSWPQTGYPWPLEISVRYSLTDDGLVVEQQICNRGTSPAPVAAGAHPYLNVGTPTIDDAVLHIPADSWLPTGNQQIPTGTVSVEGTPYDFRSARAIGDTRIDYTFTGLTREADGRFYVRLQHPSEDVHAALWLDASYRYVEIFTGDALPDEARRRRGLGVEPMTAPPNALATGTDLQVLEPGATWRGQWGVQGR
jgi:aldose 1-epimerase